MMKFKNICIAMLMPCVLSACDEPLTYSYLVQNPLVLKHELADCLAPGEKMKNEIAECEIVISAADAVNKIIEEQQNNPEKFGQRILDAEIVYAKSQEALKRAQATAKELRAKNASPAELQAADDIVLMEKKISDAKLQEMKTYLAIMGMNTPE